MVKQVWTPTKRRKIKRLRDEGYGIEDIAVQFKVKPATIRDQLQRLPKAWTEDETAQLKGLRQQGKSASQIARIMARSKMSVIGKIDRLRLAKTSKKSTCAPKCFKSDCPRAPMHSLNDGRYACDFHYYLYVPPADYRRLRG